MADAADALVRLGATLPHSLVVALSAEALAKRSYLTPRDAALLLAALDRPEGTIRPEVRAALTAATRKPAGMPSHPS